MSNDEWMLASASERVMAERPRRKLTASNEQPKPKPEGRYTATYIENAKLPKVNLTLQTPSQTFYHVPPEIVLKEKLKAVEELQQCYSKGENICGVHNRSLAECTRQLRASGQVS